MEFDLQNDHVLKKLDFDLLTSSPGSGGGVGSLCLFGCLRSKISSVLQNLLDLIHVVCSRLQ